MVKVFWSANQFLKGQSLSFFGHFGQEYMSHTTLEAAETAVTLRGLAGGVRRLVAMSRSF
jgi:hypothetical protein